MVVQGKTLCLFTNLYNTFHSKKGICTKINIRLIIKHISKIGKYKSTENQKIIIIIITHTPNSSNIPNIEMMGNQMILTDPQQKYSQMYSSWIEIHRSQEYSASCRDQPDS